MRARAVPQRLEQDGAAAEAEAEPVALRAAFERRKDGKHPAQRPRLPVRVGVSVGVGVSVDDRAAAADGCRQIARQHGGGRQPRRAPR